MLFTAGEVQLIESYPVYSAGSSTYYYSSLQAGAANTKGSYTTLIASTPFDGVLMVQPFRESAAGAYLYDIAIGTGDEVIWENIPWHATSLSYRAQFDNQCSFPTFIPKGTVVKGRVQCSGASQYLYVRSYILPTTMDRNAYPSIVHTYGADETSSEGTEIDPGGTTETKGSYTQITSATTHPYQGFRFAITRSGGNVNLTTCAWHIDVAFGASSSEEVIIADFRGAQGTTADHNGPNLSPIFPIPIPEGTRIAMRASCDITDATDRVFDTIFYGIG